ncbi:MAG TPA: head GIN domain-containing protein, partial [Chitinophagaceae bacterium]
DANAVVRDLSGFHGVKVSNAIDLYISQGSTEAVAVSAKDEKTRDRIKTEVKDGILYISFDSKGWQNWGNQKLKAYVSIRDISWLEASGASDVKVSGTLKSADLKLILSGASDFEGNLEAGNIQIEGTGASDIKITGHAGKASIEMSGASDFKGYDFSIDVCKAEISGAGDMQLSVNKELDAEASGASSIRYKGEPVVKRSESSGASSIKRKG